MTEKQDEIRLKQLLGVFGIEVQKEIIEILQRDQIRYHKEQLSLKYVSERENDLKCNKVCDWYSVGNQLNGHQECRTCGKQKEF